MEVDINIYTPPPPKKKKKKGKSKDYYELISLSIKHKFWTVKETPFTHPKHMQGGGGDPGFLERGFICIKLWGFALLILSYCS